MDYSITKGNYESFLFAYITSTILVGKPEGRRPLGRPRCMWVYNIKMDLKRDRMGWYGLNWSGFG